MKIESIVQPISHHLTPNHKLSDVAKLLEQEGKNAFPVINNDGTLLGLITKQEVADASAATPDDAQAHATIAELVKPVDVTCTPNDDVATLANQLGSQTHVAVVDDLGNLVGIADLSSYQTGTSDVEHREDILDEALDETFPASDPISPK